MVEGSDRIQKKRNFGAATYQLSRQPHTKGTSDLSLGPSVFGRLYQMTQGPEPCLVDQTQRSPNHTDLQYGRGQILTHK